MARQSTHGLKKGVAVHVTGMGRSGNGTISKDPEPGATHVWFRSYIKGGERYVAIERVRRLNGPRVAKDTIVLPAVPRRRRGRPRKDTNAAA